MQFSIEPNNGIPIYEQVVRQIKYAIAEGVLVPGQVIPSVRELAKQVAINPNTVQRAYQALQDEKIVEALRGRGMAVCQFAKQRCVSDRQSLVAQRMQDVIGEAVQSGLDPERLRAIFEETLSNSLAQPHSLQSQEQS